MPRNGGLELADDERTAVSARNDYKTFNFNELLRIAGDSDERDNSIGTAG
jgi:hypothetical protein